jgi:hypothetical protein
MADLKSSNSRQFLQSAEELVAKLSEIGTAEAMSLLREAREIVSTLKSWEKKRPEDDVRIITIRQLLELNRRVMTFLSTRQKAR